MLTVLCCAALRLCCVGVMLAYDLLDKDSVREPIRLPAAIAAYYGVSS